MHYNLKNIKFGLIVNSTSNLGDDIQSLASKQYLPHVDYLIDRERLKKYHFKQKVKLIMNGWYMHNPKNWPPSKNIIPFFISFHLSPNIAERFLTKESIEYLKSYEPIGCRDISTQNILEKHGIKSYFSGCLTLTLGYKYKFEPEKNKVLIVDVDPETYKFIPKYILKKSLIKTQEYHSNDFISNIRKFSLNYIRKFSLNNKLVIGSIIYKKIFDLFGRSRNYYEKRLSLAEIRLKEIATSSLVITSRLHVALPSLAFNVPVIFIHKNLQDPRFSGLLEYLNAFQIEDFKKYANTINWENIENPNRDKLQILIKNLIEKCENFIEKN